MVVIHFSCISDKKLDGVSVVVPKHVISQSNYLKVVLVNVNNVHVLDAPLQIPYTNGFNIESLNEPFNHPDLIVFHEIYRRQYIFIVRQIRKMNIPYVIIPHGELNLQAQKRKHLKKSIANFLIFRSIADNASAIQCLSEREMNNTFFGKRKFIGTNGIDLPFKKKDQFNKEMIHLVYIGRLDPYHKGLDMLIEALSIIKETTKNRIKVDIYGPEEKDYFSRINKLLKDFGVDNIVKLHHEVLNSEKERTLLDTDVFIQTSRFEGMPMGILEAMSYGIPCLVTEGTTLAKLIFDCKCGWTADNTPISISKAVLDMIADVSNFETYSRNARATIMALFSWDNVTKNTITQYASMIKEFER